MKKIVYLSGGIGGAKLAKGFYHSKDIDLTIIINTGDDEVIHGVPLSPDIDSVMYALAGIEGEMGWGIANDTFSVSEEYKNLIPQNFSIGDKDLALNLYRNQLLSEGKSLTEITKLFAEHLNLECNLIPMTDDTVSTKLKTDDGSLLDFQEYFVEKKAKPKLTEVVYNGAEKAKVSDQLIKNIEESEIVVIGPSNPILSIGPILSLNKLRKKLSEHNNVYVINPFIENKAIKGPSKNNFEDLGYTSDIQGIKNFYKDVGNKYIVHPGDSDGAEDTVEHNIFCLLYTSDAADE